MFLDVDRDQLRDLAVVLATAFPVLAVAYYSAMRASLDDQLMKSGISWGVSIPIGPHWSRWPLRNILEFVSRETIKSGYLKVGERFRSGADRAFIITFPLGLLFALAGLVTYWRWALGLSLICLQVAVNTTMAFSIQSALVRRRLAELAHEADGQGGDSRTHFRLLLAVTIFDGVLVAVAILFGFAIATATITAG